MRIDRSNRVPSSQTPYIRARSVRERPPGIVNPSCPRLWKKGFWTSVLLLLWTAGTAADGLAGDPCIGQGSATLERTGEIVPAVGTRFRIRVEGRPLAPVSILADLGEGPVEVPGLGTLCLDLGPRLRFVVDGVRTGSPTLDDSGTFETTIPVPRRPKLAGRDVHFQAIIADDTAPNGFAISPKLTATLLPSVIEDFRTTDRRDDAQTNALWEGDGRLVGVPALPPRTAEFDPPESPFLLAHPLIERGNQFTDGCRFQMLYEPANVAAMTGESILGMAWGPKSDFVFVSNYDDVTIRLGTLRQLGPSPSLAATYDINYDAGRGKPVTVFRGSYSVPSVSEREWEDWPAFDAPYDYHDDKRLVFEVDMPTGGDTFQLFRNISTAAMPTRRIFGDGGGAVASFQNENTQYSTRFVLQRDRGVARSLWFQPDTDEPDWFPAYIDAILPEGTSVEIEYEGGFGPAPIPTAMTGFRNSIDSADGRPSLRFRLTLRPSDSGEVPVVRAVVLPYRDASVR